MSSFFVWISSIVHMFDFLTFDIFLTTWHLFDNLTHYLNLNHLSPSQGYFFYHFWRTCPFHGATDAPVLYFWWHLSGFQSQGRSLYMLSHLCDPQIHLWCNTCWLYTGQHGSWAVSYHILADMPTSIGGGLGLKPMTVCAVSTALYTIRPLWHNEYLKGAQGLIKSHWVMWSLYRPIRTP